jgi:hypothetical protein
MSHQTKQRRYLRKGAVAARYGVVTRTVERWVETGAIPPPEYLPGSKIPLWNEAALDESDSRGLATRTAAA